MIGEMLKMAVLLVPYLLLISNSIFSLSFADIPKTVSPEDITILKALRDTFTPLYNDERTSPELDQFAVLYYGSGDKIDKTLVTEACKAQTGSKVFLKEVKNDFDISKCTFIAAKLNNENSFHTEGLIFKSLEQPTKGQICPGKKDKNIYLYTYLSPCINCVALIQKFMSSCQNREFKKLIVGFYNPYKDFQQAIPEIRDTKDVAIKQVMEK